MERDINPGSDAAPAGGRLRRKVVTAGLVASLLVGAVGIGGASAGASDRSASPRDTSPRTAAGPGQAAPGTRRVDLETPTFKNPTEITNPLFPISELTQVIQLGAEGDVALRHEITLLPQTKVIRWNGQRVETVVSQFVAYGDGRLLEVAYDYFAQADDGAVWYFGEDVFNYEDGVIDNRDGTWLAGRDGPPGMIMPAHPRVGDVYRPENIPGLVFEEVTVKRVNQTVDGPRGPVRGAILVQERLQDGVLEDKYFAPHYGEFIASVPVDDEYVTVALASPTDDARGSEPASLDRLSDGSETVFKSAPKKQWGQLSKTVGEMTAAWEAYQKRHVPPLLDQQMSNALGSLEDAVRAREVGEVRQAALDVSQAALDLEQQFEEPEDVDEDRIDVWEDQLTLDRANHDSAGAKSDRAIIAAIEARLGD